MPEALRSDGCLLCGRDNPVGLHLQFETGGDGARTEWQVDARYQGYDGVAHGGIVLAMLDEVMWYAAYGQGGLTLTAEATVRYHAPVRVGLHVRATGRVERRRGRLWQVAAELRDAADGRLLASASGRFIDAPPDIRRELLASVPPPPSGGASGG